MTAPRIAGARRLSLERAELVTASYRETEGQPWVLRRTAALERLLERGAIDLPPGDLLAGGVPALRDGLPLYPELGLGWLDREPGLALRQALEPAARALLDELEAFWRERSVEAGVGQGQGLAGLAGLGPLGAAVPDFARVFRLGMTGITSEIRHRRCVLSCNDPDFDERRDALEAAERCCRAAVAFAERFAALGRGLRPGDDVAAVCARVPRHPPQTFREALQTLLFCQLIACGLEWHGLGPGPRLDHLLLPWWRRDLESGAMSRETGVALLRALWLALDDLAGVGRFYAAAALPREAAGLPTASLTVGGAGPDGAGELAAAVLEAAALAVRDGASHLVLVVRRREGDDPALRELAAAGEAAGWARLEADDAAVGRQHRLLLGHLYGGAGRGLGLGRLDLLEAVRLRGPGREPRRPGRASRVPRAVTARAAEAIRRVPYRVSARDGLLWRGLRTALDYSTLFDAGRALGMARRGSGGALEGPAVPGLVFQGAQTTFRWAGAIDVARCVAASAAAPAASVDDALARLAADVAQVAEAYARADQVARARVPRPFLSALMTHCAARGLDATRQGDGACSEILVLGVEEAARALAALGRGGASPAAIERELALRVEAAVRAHVDHYGKPFEARLVAAHQVEKVSQPSLNAAPATSHWHQVYAPEGLQAPAAEPPPSS